jgi:hypothetical protein
MPLVYICDFCGQPITEPHYGFAVTKRAMRDTSDLPPAAMTEVPVIDVLQAKPYVVHGYHFEQDPGAVAQALYADFNSQFPDVAPPQAPQGLSAVAGEMQVVLTWTASAETDLAHYAVYRSTIMGGPYTALGDTIDVTFIDTGVAADQEHFYVVRAVDTAGNESVDSIEVSAIPSAPPPPPPDTTPPAVPTGLTATPGDASVTISWDDNPDADLASYQIFRSETSGGPYALLTNVAPPATSYPDTDVMNDTTYFYVINARDLADNQSADTAEVSATPTAPAPTPTPGV